MIHNRQSETPEPNLTTPIESYESPKNRDANLWSLIGDVALGTMLVHPLAFGIAWLKGFFLGAGGGPAPMAPTPVLRPPRYGFEGGIEGIGELFIIYIFTLGLVPLFLSLVGGVAGFIVGRQLPKRLASSGSQANLELPSKPIAISIVLWASILVIVAAGLTSLVSAIAQSNDMVTIRKIVIGIHLTVWTIGTGVAFVRNRDKRVAAWLLVIALSLPLISRWLPRFGLLTASIATVLFFIVKHRLLENTPDFR